MTVRIAKSLVAIGLVAAFAVSCSQETPAPAPSVTAEAPPAAAAPEAPPAGVPAGADDTCNAAKYAGLVGRPADMPGVPEPGPGFRHVGPDTQVTMDFREDRINMDISAEGVITGFRCG